MRVARLDDLEIGTLGDKHNACSALVFGSLYTVGQGIRIGRVVRILAHGDTEDLRELRPITSRLTFPDDPWTKSNIQAEVSLALDKQQIVIFFERDAAEVGLHVLDETELGIYMLARDEIIADPSVLIAIELEKGEAPEIGAESVLDELQEPGGMNLIIDGIVGHAITAKLDGNGFDAVDTLLSDGYDMGVGVNIVIKVIEAGSLREINIVGSTNCSNVIVDTLAETPRGRYSYCAPWLSNVIADGDASGEGRADAVEERRFHIACYYKLTAWGGQHVTLLKPCGDSQGTVAYKRPVLVRLRRRIVTGCWRRRVFLRRIR